MKTIVVMLGIVTGILAAPVRAHANLLVDWFFLNSGGTYGPNDTVIEQARLVNLAASDQNFIGTFTAANRSTFAAPPGTYVGEFGPPNGLEDFFDQFAGIDLAPGESFDFVHASYVPNGPTPPDDYVTVNSIEFGGRNTPTVKIERQFRWRVEGEPANGVVPEPSSMLLLGPGLIGLAALRRKKA